MLIHTQRGRILILSAIRLPALAIEHVAHLNAVGSRSGGKCGTNHRAKQSAIDAKHDRSEHTPVALGVSGKGGAGHGNTLRETRRSAQQYEGGSRAQAAKAISGISHGLLLTKWVPQGERWIALAVRVTRAGRRRSGPAA